MHRVPAAVPYLASWVARAGRGDSRTEILLLLSRTTAVWAQHSAIPLEASLGDQPEACS